MREKLIKDVFMAAENGTAIIMDFSFGSEMKNGISVTVIPDHCEDGADEIVICSGNDIFEISLDGLITYDDDSEMYIIENENYLIELTA